MAQPVLYDIEDILDDIEALLKANLNTKVEAITALKNKLGKPDVVLSAFGNASYFQQNWSDAILNVSPAIFYGLETIQATGSGANTLELFKIFIEVVMVDSGMDKLANRRINRYSRAIKEVCQDNFDKLPWCNKINIETVRPISFTLDSNTSEEVKVGGVSIVTALA